MSKLLEDSLRLYFTEEVNLIFSIFKMLKMKKKKQLYNYWFSMLTTIL